MSVPWEPHAELVQGYRCPVVMGVGAAGAEGGGYDVGFQAGRLEQKEFGTVVVKVVQNSPP